MASWFHHEDDFYSMVETESQSSGGRVVAGPWVPEVRQSSQVKARLTSETADDRKRKKTEETKESHGSKSKKRSRAAEVHNICEKRRKEKINDKLNTLQELIPRCNKTDKASMLDDAFEYGKSLHMQIQMMSMGSDMKPMMYTPNMQQFMAMGMMGMNQQPPFITIPSQAHIAGLGPSPQYHFPNIQAFDPSRVHFPTQQADLMSNQPQLPGYFNPYSQFVGVYQMQQTPPLQNQTTSQLSYSLESSSKEPDDQDNQPRGQGVINHRLFLRNEFILKILTNAFLL